MTIVHRVLHPTALESLADYEKAHGGDGLEAARKLDPDEIVAVLDASGLRGRGGAGFPTGRKWRTVRAYCSNATSTTVVVNAAEGEPGTFKDRTIMRNVPYRVIEGALIGALVVGAHRVVIATKHSFTIEAERMQQAIDEMQRAGWCDGIEVEVFAGPREYLYGEETALLEAMHGRYPFPRIAPPYRRGVDDVVESANDLDTGSGLSGHVEMAATDHETGEAPALVDNVETMANVPRILARGAEWFRSEGTDESPGTIVCTVTGSTQRAGVGEFEMGTPLRTVIEELGGGARPGREIRAVLPGVSTGYIPASALDTPISYEALAAIGSGLGSGSFCVFDDSDDLVAATAGAIHFLSVESCGQCTPCKQDGLRIAELLTKLAASDAKPHDVDELRSRVASVADSARCSLATQQQVIAASLFDHYGADVQHHLDGAPAVEVPLVAELVALNDGATVIDERFAAKQPDWTYNELDSGQSPAERLGEHREPERLDD